MLRFSAANVDKRTIALDHSGIVYRGRPNDRRAALAAGPDVWEVVARLPELRDSEEKRIAALAQESELHPRQIRIAIDSAAEHRRQIESWIRRSEAAAAASRRTAEEPEAMLA